VETLAVGDLVQTLRSGPSGIRWIGRRHVDCTRHPEPRDVWPVRVQAGAFGTSSSGRELPRRDLFLSPNHAVFVDDVLIPARLLINGTTIAQVPVDSITYYHVELADHDLLMTEGVPTESYLDTGDRANLEGAAGGHVRLHPDFANHSHDAAVAWETKGCAPLLLHGLRLDAIRRRLNGLAVEQAGVISMAS
jgi:Hint domain